MVVAKSNSPLDRLLAKLAEHGLESLWGLVLEPDSGLESMLDPESYSDPKSSGLGIGLVRSGQTPCSSFSLLQIGFRRGPPQNSMVGFRLPAG